MKRSKSFTDTDRKRRPSTVTAVSYELDLLSAQTLIEGGDPFGKVHPQQGSGEMISLRTARI